MQVSLCSKNYMKVLATGKESQRSIDSNSQTDYREKLNQELTELQQSEMWQAGDTFDDCAAAAKIYTEEKGMVFIPPFDHERIIEGQGTVGVELYEDLKNIDYIIVPNGGGGLCLA
ncbi:hypothetical protein FQR65_LT16060 [Abscondita terminalis]|nr:hypothetical protein FQR65_LT16060 [Abscondita terminalis]